MFLNHKSIGVTFDLSFTEKIEFEFKLNMIKTNYRVQK